MTTAAPGPSFDGRTYPYMPPRQPPESVTALLHAERTDVDPTTSRCCATRCGTSTWSTATRSSAPRARRWCVYAHDFNPVILDEAGDYVFFGPWLQYLVGRHQPGREVDPGEPPPAAGHRAGLHVHDQRPLDRGDPPVRPARCWRRSSGRGASSAGWATALHHQDLGGNGPGRLQPLAADDLLGAGLIPPVKMVEDGELRSDLEEEYLRRSRMPELVALDLRAQIAGCNVACARIGDPARALRPRNGQGRHEEDPGRLRGRVPAPAEPRSQTATWREEGYLEMAVPGDRGALP